MSYRMKLVFLDNTEIIGPIIQPNSLSNKYGLEDNRIRREIHKIGKSMIKYKIVKSYDVIEGKNNAKK